MTKNSRLINDFSWSYSRHNTFQECKKRYWYTYYGSWEGWPKTPWDARTSIDPLASYLYIIKQMRALPLFVGSTVHETIEHTLQHKTYAKPQKDTLIAKALKRFDEGILASTHEEWRKSPKKHLNLFEHYYKIPITDDNLEEAKQKIITCITNWYESPIAAMLFDERARRICVEEMHTFQLAEIHKIIVVIDLAINWKNNSEDITILFDWKTGKKSQKTDEQLFAYALFASKVWKINIERLILTPFYLLPNEYEKIGHRQKEPIREEKLKQVEQEIIASCEAMRAPITNYSVYAGAPPPDPTLFPYTEKRDQCISCPFRELCEKANYEEHSTDRLRDFVKTLS